MQRVNEFSFYELASKIHPLTSLGSGVEIKISETWYELWEARQVLDGIFVQRPLKVAVNAAAKLYQAITDLGVAENFDQIVGNLPASGSPADIRQSWQTHAIREAAREFETILAAECQVLDTYFVSKKGAYSTVDLVANAHHQIPEPTRSSLPEQTKQDIDQAGKCLAFDLPTAAAFHLLRGSEAVLRDYYDAVVTGSKRAPAKMRNWGVYIKLLSDHKAEPKVISLLTHLKDAYRNPVLHPEENYTDERVQVLFGVCVSAIVLMIAETSALQNKSAMSLPFPATVTTEIGS